MGTLGCIQDMLSRDRENRALRKANKERLKDTHQKLIDLKRHGDGPRLTAGQLEEIIRDTREKEKEEKKALITLKIRFLLLCAAILAMAAVCLWLF